MIQSICPSMCFMMHKLLVYFPQGFLCLRVPSPFSQQFLPLCAYLLAAARQTTQIHPFNLLPLLSPFCNSSGSFSAGFDDFTNLVCFRITVPWERQVTFSNLFVAMLFVV